MKLENENSLVILFLLQFSKTIVIKQIFVVLVGHLAIGACN